MFPVSSQTGTAENVTISGEVIPSDPGFDNS